MNRIAVAIKNKGMRPATFAGKIGVPTSTIYSITRGNTKIENISVGVFIKIADGLQMSVEELYYGESCQTHKYADPRQAEINGHFDSLNESSKSDLVGFVKSFAADPERRIVKDREESLAGKAAMGA